MKKLFSEAEVELTLISALEDILTASGSDLFESEDEDVSGWDQG